MKRTVLSMGLVLTLVFFSFSTISCVTTGGGTGTGSSQSILEGKGKEILAVVGAGIGVAAFKKHPVLAALGGAGAGWLLGYAIEDIVQKASQEAVQQNKTVEYHNADFSRQVIATPVGTATPSVASPQTKCQKVQTIIYENKKEIANYTDDVCTS